MSVSNPQNNPPSTPPEADIKEAIREILYWYNTTDSLGNEEKYFFEAIDKFETLLNSALIKELETILKNSSGGGSWRRNIISRLSQLRGKE